ncbi:MAG: site-2 protease family protein, partial [Candidatus Omnitrophota bacterium]
MLSTLVVLIVFSILILVHELGHMLTAKKLGVKVERFSLGFGKKLFGIKRG